LGEEGGKWVKKLCEKSYPNQGQTLPGAKPTRAQGMDFSQRIKSGRKEQNAEERILFGFVPWYHGITSRAGSSPPGERGVRREKKRGAPAGVGKVKKPGLFSRTRATGKPLRIGRKGKCKSCTAV